MENKKGVKRIKNKRKINSSKNYNLKMTDKANKINNILVKNTNQIKNIVIIIKLLLILSLFRQILSKKRLLIQNLIANITLKIKGPGIKKLFGDEFAQESLPTEININGQSQLTISRNYNFSLTENTVELMWNHNNIQNCVFMYQDCKDITEFNFDNFDTSEIQNMGCMFKNCLSLTSLNVSNFVTSKVINIGTMFEGCSSLTSINLSNFDTSKVIYMDNLFNGCSLLTSLDLSNFDTSSLKLTQNMFLNCINLQYINIKNFDDTNLETFHNMFYNIRNFVVICIKETNAKILPQLKNTSNCYIIDCSYEYKLNNNKIINKTSICTDLNGNYIQYKYEYKGISYEHCANGDLINNSTINHCNCDNENCFSCPQLNLNDNFCLKYNSNFNKTENEDLNEDINCCGNLKGYFLDNNDLIYKKCYVSCDTCEIEGSCINHNCLSCNEDFPFEISVNNYINCYKNLSDHNYFDPTDYCNDDKKYDIKDLIEMIKNMPKNENETEYYDSILEKIESSYLSGHYDISSLDNEKEEILDIGKMKITFTTSFNQANNKDNNITSINLGFCEALLRNTYNISNNSLLYMVKLDIIQDGMKIPKIEYRLYSEIFNNNNLTKLNLSICEKSPISLIIPLDITEDLDKLNSSSGYYNDICYTSSENGIDITNKDRKKNYINQPTCQDDCDFTGYNYDNKLINCSCKVKESSYSFADMKINKTKLYENFIDIRNIANINILICYKNLFSKKGILSNIGSYIIIVIIILHIIFIIIHDRKYKYLLKKKIKAIIFAINNYELIDSGKKENITINKITINGRKNKKKKSKTNKEKKVNKNILLPQFKKEPEKINDIPIIKIINPIQINNINNNIEKSINYSTTKLKRKKKQNSKIIFENSKENLDSKLNNQKMIEKIKKILRYTNNEKNLLSYNLAIQNDKRTYGNYYISLLKIKNNFLFSFFHNKDYNSKIIKIDIFFINFSIYYAVNCLFFDDDTMHKIYITNGSFNFEYELPKIIYSSLISMVLNSLLKILALSDNDIIYLKSNKSKVNLNKRKKILEKKLRIKFISYSILSSILLLFFWYYIGMFGAIYRNTQLHLFEDTLISFGLSFVYPFFIYLLPGMFRIPALSSHKKSGECLYNSSKILQKF